jgi:hypothetical protein
MSKSTNNIIYDKYYKATLENTNFKHGYESLGIDNLYLTARVRDIETKKGIMERNLITIG